MLIVGWTSGIWIISIKTLQSWQRVFSWLFCCFKKSTKTLNNRRNNYFTNNKQDLKQHQYLIVSVFMVI